MINIGKKSKLKPEEIVSKSVEYFGPDGLGLKVVDKERCCARFEGGGGFVNVQITEIVGGDGSDVTITGREYDHKIKQFLNKLK